MIDYYLYLDIGLFFKYMKETFGRGSQYSPRSSYYSPKSYVSQKVFENGKPSSNRHDNTYLSNRISPSNFINTAKNKQANSINNTKHQKLLRHKIQLEKAIIANNMKASKNQLIATFDRLENTMKNRLDSFEIIMSKSLSDSPKIKTHILSQQKSPFDINQSMDFNLPSMQQLGIQDNTTEFDEKLRDFVIKYSQTGTKKLLYNEDKMLQVLDKLIQKMDKFIQQIISKHIQMLINISAQGQYTNKLVNNLPYLSEPLGNPINEKTNSPNKNIYTYRSAEDDKFKDLYNRLNMPHQKINQQSNFMIPISQQIQINDRSLISQQKADQLYLNNLHNNSLSESGTQYEKMQKNNNNCINPNNNNKQYINEPFFVIHKSDKIKINSPKKNQQTLKIRHQQIQSKSEQQIGDGNKDQKKIKNDPIKIDKSQRSVTMQWCQNVKIKESQSYNFPEITGTNQEKFNSNQNTILCIINISIVSTGKQFIALGCKDTNIYVYTYQKFDFVSKLVGHSASVCTMNIYERSDDDQSFLMSGGDTGCSSLILWNIKQWTIHTRINFHEAALTTIMPINLSNQISNAHEYILTGSYDRTIKIYNLSQNIIQYGSQSNFQGPIISIIPINNQEDRLAIAVGGLGILLGQVIAIIQNSNVRIQIKLQREIKYYQNRLITCLNAVPGTQKILIGLDTGQLAIMDTLTTQVQEIDSKNFLKKYNNQINDRKYAALASLAIQRLHKQTYPLSIIGFYGHPQLTLVNWESKTLHTLNSQLDINIKHGCGIGPLIILTKQKKLLVVNQSLQNRLNIYKLEFL